MLHRVLPAALGGGRLKKKMKKVCVCVSNLSFILLFCLVLGASVWCGV